MIRPPFRVIAAVAALVGVGMLAACVDDLDIYRPYLRPPYLVGASIPGALVMGSQVATYYPDVAYGPMDDQRLDALVPPATGPTAALVYFGGNDHYDVDRSRTWSERGDDVVEGLGEGMAWFNVGVTPLSLGTETVGVSRQLEEGRRALRYITLHAESFNIDPARIAVLGDKSGGGIALWLALWGAGPDPLSPDPLMQVGATIRAVAVRNPSAPWDPRSWETIFGPLGLSLGGLRFASEMTRQQMMGLYGATDISAVVDRDSSLAKYWDEVRIAEALRPDIGTVANDALPDIYVRHVANSIGFPRGFSELLNHPYHARYLARMAADYGAPVYISAPVLALDTTAGGSQSESAFLVERLAPVQ